MCTCVPEANKGPALLQTIFFMLFTLKYLKKANQNLEHACRAHNSNKKIWLSEKPDYENINSKTFWTLQENMHILYK